MKLESLRELFIEELQDLYSAETMIVKALPKMAAKTSSPELKRAFEEHLRQTQIHVQRLDQIFDKLEAEDEDIDREDKTCEGIKGIIKEGEELLKKDAEPEVRDAGLIAAAQRVEHYEIAGYGTVRTYANLLGHSDFVSLLEETLTEEKETDELLSGIAERINPEAKAA